MFKNQAILCLVACLLTGLLLEVTSAQADSGRVLQSASELNYPPFAVVRPDGSADGFSVELLKAVGQVMGVDVRFNVGPWHEIKEQLTHKRIDVLPLVSYSEKRDRVFDFTAPYLEMHGAIFVRKGESSVQNEADLKDKEVLVMRGDTAHEYLVRKNLTKNFILTETFEEAMKLLSKGKHDAVVCQYVMGRQLLKQLGITNVVSTATERETTLKPLGRSLTGFTQKFCFAVPQGEAETLALLNEGLAIVVANGTYDRLYAKWIKSILPRASVPKTTILKYLLYILAPILLLLIITWGVVLRREVVRKTANLEELIRFQEETKSTLIESEERFRQLYENAPVPYQSLDYNGGFLYVNLAWLDTMGGYSKDEVIGRSFGDFLLPEWEEHFKYNFPRFKDKGEILGVEFEMVRKDGSVILVQFNGKIAYDKNGDFLQTHCIFRDITLERLKDDELRKSKEEWENTFNAMADIVTIQAEDMRILKANKAAYDFFDAAPGTLNGKHCYELFRGASSPCPNCPEGKAIRDNKNHSEIVVHENLGKIFNITTAPVLDEKGEYQHIVHIARDITERKKMEEELFQAHKMEAIGTLAGGIAHDFNNILAAILGYAEMIKHDLADGTQVREYIDQVINAGIRARDLVRQILTFSRKKQERQQAFNPALILKEAIKLLYSSLPSTIEIRQEIDPNCGSIIANPTNVHQVLVNLCTNALHAMENEQGVLTIRLSPVDLEEGELLGESGVSPGKFIELMVRDTGQGMDKAIMDRIFEPYFTTKGVGRGSGMGLALVHGIVQNSGGFIRVESAINRGTIFRIYWPLATVEVKAVEDSTEVSLPSGNERILIVDDENAIVNMYRATLERLGYAVTAKNNSVKTLEEFRLSPENFDLLITDQTMPNLTGAELAKNILQIRPDMPIVLCTGFSSLISEEKAEEIGIKKFIMKPVEQETLAKTVREVLDGG